MKPEEFIEHPGREYLHPSKIPPFERFLKFIDPAITTDISRSFIELLGELHSYTGVYWKPGRCHYSWKIVSTLNEILPKHLPGSQSKQFFSGLHKWTNLILPNQDSIIIDPVGLSVLNRSFSNFPYFGYLENYPFKTTGNLTYARGIPSTPQ